MRRYLTDKVPINDLDITNWEDIYTGDMTANELHTFKSRKKAIDLFFSTDIPIDKIVEITGIVRSEIYRFASRCIMYDEVNKILGYRGLVHYQAVVPYNRKTICNINPTNYSGAFQLLFEKLP
ncbi:Integrase catalytic domain-containing protein OS=Lysinibacillus sphaericus OX=1421 GN=LS41612_12385 PE=4 SV=1 [Lysinibacillus sphaericus]